MIPALHLLPRDAINIERAKEVFARGSRTEEELDSLINLQRKLIQLRIDMERPYSSQTFVLAKREYGECEYTNVMLAEIQVVLDSENYVSAWDKSFNYPSSDSPLLKACPNLAQHLETRYKIFNLAEIELLGDYEFGFADYVFDIHPFVPAELNRKLHRMFKDGKRDRGNMSLAFQTGMYEKRDGFLPYFKKDYYRGPAFSKAILDIADGVTEHWRHDEDPDSIKGMYLSAYFKRGLKRTEFMWGTSDSTKDFAVEEVVEPTTTELIDGEACVCVRYIHTQFSLTSGKCIHFDGCMNIYNAGDYQQRFDTAINRRAGAKAKKHMKLFRIDGEDVISNDEWILLAGAFFKDNELVQEYFGAKLPWDEIKTPE